MQLEAPKTQPLFDSLIRDLERQGFVVGVDHHVRLHRLLRHLSAECNPRDLKRLLCPIFATNAEQQTIFNSSFERYERFFWPTADPIGPILPAQPTQNAIAWRRMWPACTLAIALLAGNVWLEQRRGAVPSPAPIPLLEPNASQARTPAATKTPAATETPAQPTTSNGAPPAKVGLRRNSLPKLTWRTGMTLGCILVYLLLEFRRHRARNLVLERRRGVRPPWSWPVRVSASLETVFRSDKFYRVAQRLRRRETGEGSRIDVRSTVSATVATAGFPQLRYRPFTRSVPYLFLVERASSHDHQSGYYSELVRALEGEGLLLKCFYYDRDPRVCATAGGETIYLDDLARLYSDSRTVLIGSGHACLNPVTGRLADWTRVFQQWNTRAILTPVPQQEWVEAERELSREFQLSIATLDGFLALCDALDAPELCTEISCDGHVATTSPLRAESPRALVERLRATLSPRSFSWLSACSVYPDLQYDLSAHLATLAPGNDRPLEEDSVLRVISLAWFREGSIPDEIRQLLISGMQAGAEATIRETIIRLLAANPAPVGSYAEEDRQWEILGHRARIEKDKRRIRRDARRLSVKAPAAAMRRRFVAAQLLHSSPVSRLVFRLPDTLKRIFFPDGLPETGFRPLIRFMLLVLVVAALAAGPDVIQKMEVRDHLNKGVQAFKDAQYPLAVQEFKAAVELDPTFATARLYLATAYQEQYIPGAQSPENDLMADTALAEFRQVLQLDPGNTTVMAYIANFYLNEKKFDDAEQWYKKLIAADPPNADAYYRLGFIAWSKWYPVYAQARASLGMKPEDPGPIRDKKVKAELKAKYGALLDAALNSLDKAIQLKPDFDDAMAYENLVIRERADLADTKAEYEQQVAIANNWIDKAMAVKRAQAAKAAQKSP